jgi:NitT/TauT family transport system permease protein
MDTSKVENQIKVPEILDERLPEEVVKHDRGHIFGGLLLFVIVIAVWETSVRVYSVSELLLPAPSIIAFEFIDNFGILFKHFLVTTMEVYVGYVIAAIIGIGLAALVDRSKLMRALIQPYIIVLQATPKIALAPFFIIWFGFGVSSKIAIAAMITFFPIFINTLAGFASVNPRVLDLMAVLKADRRQILWKVKVPHSLPYVFAGLEIGILLSLIGAIVGEFISSTEGLGYLILNYNFQLQTAAAFAALVMLIVLGILSYAIVLGLKKRIIFWLGKI